MKAKFFLMSLMICLSIGSVCGGLSACSAGAHVGSVGAGASVG